MSLKSFHVVFIVLATLSSLGFAAWVFIRSEATLASGLGAVGILSVLMGLALAAYGVWFVARKSARLII